MRYTLSGLCLFALCVICTNSQTAAQTTGQSPAQNAQSAAPPAKTKLIKAGRLIDPAQGTTITENVMITG